MNCPKSASGKMMGFLRHPVHLVTFRYAIVHSKALSRNSIIKSTKHWNHPIYHSEPTKAAIKDNSKQTQLALIFIGLS